MVYADSGWKDKRVFIANRNENAPAYFVYRYNDALRILNMALLSVATLFIAYL